eukprot:4644297-Pyramimonas_sp.AAC.1
MRRRAGRGCASRTPPLTWSQRSAASPGSGGAARAPACPRVPMPSRPSAHIVMSPIVALVL